MLGPLEEMLTEVRKNAANIIIEEVIRLPKRRLRVDESECFFEPSKTSVNAKIPGLNVAAKSRGMMVNNICDIY